MAYYLNVEDYIQAAIGPFETEADARAHFDWAVAQGDSATFVSITQGTSQAGALLVMTPDEDRGFQRHSDSL